LTAACYLEYREDRETDTATVGNDAALARETAMPVPEKPIKRMTLRELLSDAEKRARQLAEHLQSAWLARAVDVRELSRTVRRRSHFPTVNALHNSVQKLLELSRETEGQIDYLVQELEAIREHARREQSQRV
jgi:hypothetical protein